MSIKITGSEPPDPKGTGPADAASTVPGTPAAPPEIIPQQAQQQQEALQQELKSEKKAQRKQEKKMSGVMKQAMIAQRLEQQAVLHTGPEIKGSTPPAPGLSAGPPPPAQKLGGAPPPMPVGAKKQAPVGEYTSKAFNGRLTPEMFKDSGIPHEKLENACILYNQAIAEARRETKAEGIVSRMTGEGGPLAGKRTTTQVTEMLKTNPDLIENLAKDVWREVKGSEPMPTVQQLKKQLLDASKPKDMGAYTGVQKSQSGAIEVKSWKEVSVTQKALEDANQKLKDAKSFIRLVEVGREPDGRIKIRPEWNPERKVTAEHEDSHTKLAEANQSGKGYVSWADCHRTAQTIMGSEAHNSGVEDSEHVMVGGTAVAPLEKKRIDQGEIQGATNHGANRGMHAMFQRAMPDFADELRKKLTPEDKEGFGKILRAIDGAKPEPGKLGNYRLAYREIQENPSAAKLFAERYAVNEGAKPQVGQAFAQINDEAEKAHTKDKDLWNFHFAGVVMVDGDSYMTLENLSVEGANAMNDGWYFRMYDSSKSFHAENKKDTHVGHYPTTMLFAPTRQ
jgi:hypothetical protein